MVIIKKHWYAVVSTISILFEVGCAKDGSDENVSKISRHFDGDVFSLKGNINFEKTTFVKEKIMI